MALYNEILVGRFNRALQKLLAIKGPPPVPQLAGEVQPQFAFPLGAEFRYLESWNLYSDALDRTGVAAQNNGFQFRNPPTSNIIAVLTKLMMNDTVDQTFNISVGPQTADLLTINASKPSLDARGIGNAALVVSSDHVVVDLASVVGVWSTTRSPNAAGTPGQSFDAIITDLDEIPILPGRAVRIITQALNSETRIWVRWRERFLEDSERA